MFCRPFWHTTSLHFIIGTNYLSRTQRTDHQKLLRTGWPRGSTRKRTSSTPSFSVLAGYRLNSATQVHVSLEWSRHFWQPMNPVQIWCWWSTRRTRSRMVADFGVMMASSWVGKFYLGVLWYVCKIRKRRTSYLSILSRNFLSVAACVGHVLTVLLGIFSFPWWWHGHQAVNREVICTILSNLCEGFQRHFDIHWTFIYPYFYRVNGINWWLVRCHLILTGHIMWLSASQVRKGKVPS